MLEGNTSFQWKETLRGDEKKKKSFIPKFFSARDKKRRRSKEGSFDPSITVDLEEDLSFSDPPTILRKSFSDPEITSRLEKLNISDFTSPMSNISDNLTLRAFVATWNVGGKAPHSGLTLDNFLRVEDESDIYVLGFQEIVPLNAGNVLVIEDNEPAVKWLALINEALNKSQALDNSDSLNIPPAYDLSFSSQTSFTRSSVSIDSKLNGGKLFFQKRLLKSVCKNFRSESGKRLKTCNCHFELEKKYNKDSCFRCQATDVIEEDSSSEEDENSNNLIEIDIPSDTNSNQMKYGLVACKQMVGIFVTIWARKELVQHIGHLRVSRIGRGIMGRLGNKGCISVSMSLYQTNLCFVCSHLASGEKEGDELRRNSDVIEILKNTQFRKICKTPGRRNPERILDHDRIIWLGDLNYRIGLSYLETRKFLEDNDWDALLEKDQLKKEREAGRVFNGWQEGKIYFAPTYKYSNNSDDYAGETIKSKKKRRTPAWCDRILWHGEGIEQLLYIRGESRFSDHRPVCAVFTVNICEGKSKKGLNTSNMKVEVEELLPPSNTFSVLNKL